MKVFLGKVSSPFGLQGAVSCVLYSADPPTWSSAHLSDSLSISILRYPHLGKKKLCICRIEGVDTPEKARNFSGNEFWIERQQLPEISPDEVYLCDLVDLPVLKANEVVGHVIATHDFGAGIILEVQEDPEPSKDANQKAETTKASSRSNKSVVKKKVETTFIHWREIDRIEEDRIILKVFKGEE